jgi:hypothetical protein
MGTVVHQVDLTDILKDQVPLSERHSGYLVDLSTIQFTDEDGANPTSWVHALAHGEFKHPLWGKLQLTADRMKRFASNVNNRVRGIDLAIDYDHISMSEAAGWVKQAEARNEGLFLLVEWTMEAAEKIRKKKYRYFSSEFVDEWENETGEKFEDVILGGGLTNRPFLKNLLPVNLSELYKPPIGKENEPMELKELLKALGLSEDGTEQDALDAVKKLQETPPVPTPDPPKDPDLVKLLEENPTVKALADRVAELEAGKTLSEAASLVESWTTRPLATAKYVLPPAVTEKLTETLISGSTKFRESITEVIGHILEHGLVTLKEQGRNDPNRTPNENEPTAIAEFNVKVKELMDATEGMSFADAYSEASRDEELFNRYRRETLAGEIVEEQEVD